jgi:signal transduction histidine kinase
MSLERKLPLLVIAVLIATLAIAVALAYREVRQSAELAATARIRTASRQLAALSSASIAERAKLLRAVAASPAIRAAATRPASDQTPTPTSAGAHHLNLNDQEHAAVVAALHRLVLPTDSTLAIELWSANAQLVDSIGAAPEMPRTSNDHPRTIAIPDQRLPQTAMPASNAPQFLPFFEGQDRHLYYWMTVPVIEHGVHVGWIAEQGRIKSRPDADRQINGLIGDHTAAYFHNQNGHFWSTLGGVPIPEPTGARSLSASAGSDTGNIASYSRASHGGVLATALPITGTPWWLVLEVDRSAVLAGARSLLIKFTLFSLLLLLVAATASWLLIRRVVRPLVDLTEAATSMARGDYSARVAVQHQDEVGRLGNSFNEMAGEVAASHEKLAGQVREARRLADELDQAREVAVSASKAKSNFLATMSHEIRTPINAIMGYADILDLGISGPLNPDQHENLRRIRNSSSHLLALINDVLDLSKIESGSMRLGASHIQTRPSIDAAVALVAPVAAEKHIQLVIDTSDSRAATYLGDERGVQQALANLLSNAVKFTNNGGEVRVTCTMARPVAGSRLTSTSMYVAIQVSDTGIGIAEQKIGQLFQPFTQLEAEDGNPYTRQRSGAGLGLSISRHLAHMMGGDITVQSRPQQGSTFTLWLPSSNTPVRNTAATVSGSDSRTPALAVPD